MDQGGDLAISTVHRRAVHGLVQQIQREDELDRVQRVEPVDSGHGPLSVARSTVSVERGEQVRGQRRMCTVI